MDIHLRYEDYGRAFSPQKAVTGHAVAMETVSETYTSIASKN
jgi:hypothetical protein